MSRRSFIAGALLALGTGMLLRGAVPPQSTGRVVRLVWGNRSVTTGNPLDVRMDPVGQPGA